jgi:hypothetical protein
MTIIKPTIGRRVWYWPSKEETYEGSFTHADGLQPCDAGIAFVHSGRMVNLTVADHHGVIHSRCSVRLLQEGDSKPPADQAYAQWMPYQTGQAAKQAQPAAEVDAQRARIDSIARVCHEVNRAYCEALGDDSQLPWGDAPGWQRESARMGVDLHLSGDFGPEASHIGWMQEKLANGWTYGPVKDPAKLQHPCMVPFADLPREQQAKDFIFRAVVHALKA